MTLTLLAIGVVVWLVGNQLEKLDVEQADVWVVDDV